MAVSSSPPGIESGLSNEPSEPEAKWAFEFIGLLAAVQLVFVVVEVESPLPAGPAWALGVAALLAGTGSYFVRGLTARAMVMLGVAMVGAGLLTHVWGEEDLSQVWFGAAVLGGCLTTVIASRTGQNQR